MGSCGRLREKGSALILVIGVIAALAIMAAGLVTLTTNVMSNTSKDRTRTKAFHVAEGALDVGMNTLATKWPAGPTAPTPSWNATAFRTLGQFANAEEYPDPKAGLGAFSAVEFYDDDKTGGGYSATASNSAPASNRTDANDNDIMWVVARGATGSQKAAVQAKVRRQSANTNFPHGIALYVGGQLDNNAPGQTKKGMVHIEDQGDAPSVNGYATSFGGATTSEIFDTGITPHVKTPKLGDGIIPPIGSLIDQGIIDQITALAQTPAGRYYDVTLGDSMPTDLSGICVIRTDSTHPVNLGNATINSYTSPGILLILRKHTAPPDPEPIPSLTFNMSGNGVFYGVVYVEGTCDTAHGTPSVHGMLACVTDDTMKGTPDVYYNDTLISALSGRWTLTVNLVPNTWRDIH